MKLDGNIGLGSLLTIKKEIRELDYYIYGGYRGLQQLYNSGRKEGYKPIEYVFKIKKIRKNKVGNLIFNITVEDIISLDLNKHVKEAILKDKKNTYGSLMMDIKYLNQFVPYMNVKSIINDLELLERKWNIE